MVIRVMNWVFLGILMVAAFILGQVCHQAWGFTADPFILRLETLFHVSPGGPFPVDMRAPDIRLQYTGTHPTGHGCYQVGVCRYR